LKVGRLTPPSSGRLPAYGLQPPLMSNVMRLERLQPGFSTADTSYPELETAAGCLSVRFASSGGEPVHVLFSGVAAFSWQESNDSLLEGEPWDGACELFGSHLLSLHSYGRTLNSAPGLRHVRFNFNEWGRLDVLCTGFAAAA